MTATRADSLSAERGNLRPSDTAARLLTADELAERWRVTPKQVRRLAKEGSLPAVRIGRYVRFRVEAIEAWEQRMEATDD